MGLLATAIETGPEVKKGPPCTVGSWLSTLDDETREEAATILGDTLGWPHTAVVTAFKPLGCTAAAPTIARHRRGDCKNCG